MTKNKKSLKTGKPIKLSLADFHNHLDKKLNPEKNGKEMNSEKWTGFRKNDGSVGGTRGRGVYCDKLPIVSRNLEDLTFQIENTTKSAKNETEPKKIRENQQISKLSEKPINPCNQREAGNANETKKILLRKPNPQDAIHGRPKTRVRSSPRIPTPPRNLPQELKEVDRMTSADFRHDYAAHLDTMRTRQKGQQHMLFFQSAMHQNRHLFKGRKILVLCCGTGTLALMAAQMGAKRVYAVDYSKVTGYAELVVRQNRFETIIKVLNGRMKDLKLPEKVDGIICNWMGHCLLYESEILEVLEARDRWLKKGGFILPDLGSLFLVASEEHMLKNDRCNWWRSVYGFNMNAMRRYALAEPRYAKTTGEKLLTLAHRILSIDLKKAKKEDLFIDRQIRLKVNREGYLECFLLFFDVEFSSSHTPLKMSCNPCLRLPYKSLWLQTVLFVEQPFIMRSNLHYTGNLKFKPLKPNNFKEMEIRIEFYEGLEYDDHCGLCTRRVAKRWLMLEHFQTFSEVESCQDEQGENGGHDF
ncbi:protein arginine N-methyltransferase 1 [Drosophila elegans]|uniref:protein arginine N-methyltransferase 1 n=1 Tax=Drosophila elegans TaxID=30023 RepID=UPI0007E86C85|nr:protein arginine N-methyltransferase 1 [Drosophila elegans]